MKYPTIWIACTLFIGTLIFSCTNPATMDSFKTGTTAVVQWDSLFNGKNLQGWYSYQKAPESTSEVPGISRDERGNYLEAIDKIPAGF